MSTNVQPPEMLGAAPGAYFGSEQCRRATSLAIALELTKGRSVPIQGVMRIAEWIYSGERETV